MVGEYDKLDRTDQQITKLSLNYSFCFITLLDPVKDISQTQSIFKRDWCHYEQGHNRPAENIYCDSDWLIRKEGMGNNDVCIYPIHHYTVLEKNIYLIEEQSSFQPNDLLMFHVFYQFIYFLVF